MHGLFRARGFTQDDGHIFCLPNQISDEIVGVLDLMEQVLSTFGFSQYEVNLSTRPEKSVGELAAGRACALSFLDSVGCDTRLTHPNCGSKGVSVVNLCVQARIEFACFESIVRELQRNTKHTYLLNTYIHVA